ncbi:MAG: hypothetical protein RLZZ22_881 [Pseudomonadota bacterium]
MSAAPTEPTLRQRIEGILHDHSGRGVALTRLYELLPEAAISHVRLTVKNLMKRNLVIRHGTMRYPAYQLVRAGDPLHRPAEAAPVELVQALHTKQASKPRVKAALAEAVTWPADVKIQHFTLARKPPPYTGTDWTGAMTRSDCEDHQLVPSRRGDMRIAHRGPMGICGARKRRECVEQGSNP